MQYGEIVGVSALLAAFACMPGVAAQVKVKKDSAPVYSKMTTASTVIKTLKKGDPVEIEIAIAGEDNRQWCCVREPGQDVSTGYVPCEFLERPLPSSAAVPVQAADSPGAQRSAASDDFWSPTHRATAGETRFLSYSHLLADDFEFSSQQKEQITAIAQQIGIPACIEETDRYVRKGAMPPDILSGAPINQCHWRLQALIEKTLALVTPEQRAAHRTMYTERRREVTGHRQVLEMRSRGR